MGAAPLAFRDVGANLNGHVWALNANIEGVHYWQGSAWQEYGGAEWSISGGLICLQMCRTYMLDCACPACCSVPAGLIN